MENRDILKISRKSKVGIMGSSETLFNFEGPEAINNYNCYGNSIWDLRDRIGQRYTQVLASMKEMFMLQNRERRLCAGV